MRHVNATIETRDVYVVAECPDCCCEMREHIADFDATDLWYGQEDIVCPQCGQQFRISYVSRDC